MHMNITWKASTISGYEVNQSGEIRNARTHKLITPVDRKNHDGVKSAHVRVSQDGARIFVEVAALVDAAFPLVSKNETEPVVDETIRKVRGPKGVAVMCKETGIIYPSKSAAARANHMDGESVTDSIKYGRPRKGCTFVIVNEGDNS